MKGFTLVELMVAIAICGIIAAVLVSMFRDAYVDQREEVIIAPIYVPSQ